MCVRERASERERETDLNVELHEAQVTSSTSTATRSPVAATKSEGPGAFADALGRKEDGSPHIAQSSFPSDPQL